MGIHPKPSGPNPEMGSDGEGAATRVGAFDMISSADRAIVRKYRWLLTDEQRERYMRALDAALGLAIKASDHRAMNNCVRTLATLEAQNQADEHLAIRLAAAQAGVTEDEQVVKIVWTDPPKLMESGNGNQDYVTRRNGTPPAG